MKTTSDDVDSETMAPDNKFVTPPTTTTKAPELQNSGY